MVFEFKLVDTIENSIHHFVIYNRGEKFGTLQIYNAQILKLGFWFDKSKGSYGLDYFITHPSYREHKFGFDMATQFLHKIFKAESYFEILANPHVEEPQSLKEFWGADYRIREQMQSSEGGAILLEVFWTE